MAVKIKISPKVLKWAIEQVKGTNSYSKVGELLNIWLKGDKTPTFNEIVKVSRICAIPLGYFLLQDPPKENLSILGCMTIKNTKVKSPSRDLINLIYDMKDIQDWAHDNLIYNGNLPLNFIGKLNTRLSLSTLTKKVKDFLEIEKIDHASIRSPRVYFNRIRKAISNTGVIIMLGSRTIDSPHHTLNIEEFRSFALTNNYAPLIYITISDDIRSMLFSLIYEFIHICMGRGDIFNDRYGNIVNTCKLDRICNSIVCNILMPGEEFLKEWKLKANKENIEDVAEDLSKIFYATPIVVVRWAYYLHLLDDKTYIRTTQDILKEYMGKKFKSQSWRTLDKIDRRFLSMLVGSVKEGTTLYTDAFRLIGVDRGRFSKLAKEIEDK